MVYYSPNRYNKVMFLVGLISWWYGKGWSRYIVIIKSRLESTIDFFSIEILIQTLFAPFRQISAGKIGGSGGNIFSGLVDKLISRMIGAMLRTIVLLAGSIVIVLQALGSLLLVIFWLLVPAFPIVGLILTVIGWTPSWL